MKNIKYLLLIVVFLSTSCHRAENYHISRNNIQTNCQTIWQKINLLNQQKQQIETHNKFSFANMMIFPALIKTYKLTISAKKIDKNLIELNKLSITKNCKKNLRLNNNPYNNMNYPANLNNSNYPNYLDQNYQLNHSPYNNNNNYQDNRYPSYINNSNQNYQPNNYPYNKEQGSDPIGSYYLKQLR